MQYPGSDPRDRDPRNTLNRIRKITPLQPNYERIAPFRRVLRYRKRLKSCENSMKWGIFFIKLLVERYVTSTGCNPKQATQE